MYMYICKCLYILICIYIERDTERQRDNRDKTNRKEVQFDLQNLKLCYEIPNYSFDDKEKRTNLEAALSPYRKI